MGEMRSSRRTEASLKSSAQLLTDHSFNTELTTAWKSLAQSKAALRHIENHLEATPGTGVVLDSVEDSLKKKASRTTRSRDGQVDASSKVRGGNQQSPAKSSSRSPLRNTTQDSNVRKSSSVEFREPLASYREATPPSHPLSQLEAYNLQSVPGSSYTSSLPHSDRLPSQLLYQRETGDNQTDRDLDSTHSSALEYAEVRYLNDQSALDILKTENAQKAQLVMEESSPCIGPTPGSSRQGESTSSSPGSASQRLENLKRHQPDGKLEKLKERIRRQRKHLEEAAEREKQQGQVEKPIVAAVESDSAGISTMPTVKIRKVAAAPPAPTYKGFNCTETKYQTPDGKVWSEQDFHNLSREIYRDTSCLFPESSRSKHQQQKEQRAERSTERRPSKLVRKVHKLPAASDLNPKPVISTASWREGQKLIKTVLGPGPKLPREEHGSHPADRRTQTDSRHHSDPHSEPNRRSRPNSTERPRSRSQERPTNHSTNTYLPSSSARDKAPLRVSADLLSADIQGILDDLQLDCKAAEEEERARKRSRGGSVGRRGRAGSGSQTRMPVSAWGPTRAANISSRGCRSASPTTHHADADNKGQKKRHYDADAIRQYLARQQEERKRRQAEEKRAIKEEAEKKNQRLQELYKKQREVAKTVPSFAEALVAPVQKRLQETYNKLLLEDTQLGEEATQHAARSSQTRPMYQPSGESDKENKRLEVPQSPSSSDKSLNDLMPPRLSRNDMDVGDDSLFHPDHLNPSDGPTTGPSCVTQAPSNEHLLSQLLRLEAAVAASNIKYTERPATAPYKRSQNKISRIEALKATATSLSNRIEKEALRFAGQGINYGAATSVDVDTVVASRTQNPDQCWAETNTLFTRNDDMSPGMQKVLTSSYNSTPLPGAGNLHEFRGKTHTGFSNPRTVSSGVTGPTYNGYTQERNGILDSLDMEKRTDKEALRTKMHKEDTQADLHDSSAGSISEGPLLSEGSFSEDEGSPHNHVPKQDHLEAQGYFESQRKEKQRLLEFQKEAAKCPALSSPFLQHDSSRAPWEELNKGSPLSVINIFTRNVQGHVKVNERNSQRNSPPANSSHSGASPGSAVVYEDDFVSSHSSKISEHRGSSSPSQSQHLSPGSTPNSSPLSRQSDRRKGTISDQSDATLVEEQRSSCSPPSEEPSSDYRKRGSSKSSSHTQAKSINSNDTLGETSRHSPQRPRLASPSRSPEPSCPPEADSLSGPLRNGANNPDINTSFYPNQTESRSTGELQYSPAVLQQQMAAELHYLESIEESIKQLGAVERMMGVSMAQQESVSLAQMLKAKQHLHEREIYELKIKAEREALETKLQQEENKQRVAMAHMELQENLAASQKEPLEKFQESTYKMMSQQAEAARHTADAARHIKEVNNMDDKESTSVATEYSLKFEESMTEDEIEERSFRSLLPSEAHRRGTLEKKSRHHEEADDDDAANHNASLMSGSHSTIKNAHIAFSDGQDSFSQFTMEMVRQYMKDEEVRLQHQSSLLHLRQKALKEKTRAEMAWLEHQKKKLRDKGEDDKMPPIRKKQRGLLLKLQQEQAEIKRLQEANKAARKERQLLLKHQEEIERMRNTTLRLKERLKCAEGQTPPETPVSEPPGSESTSPSVRHEDDIRSASPSLSVSGSETSSIMQKLKKMRSHMDEKFLTKREQQLMQRRHHAEELLQWKKRLDQEEAEVRRMEKEALAVWDKKRDHKTPGDLFERQGEELTDIGSNSSHFETRSDSEKELVSEDSHSSVTTESSLHPEEPAPQQLGGPAASAQPAPASETSLASIQTSLADYSQDFTSESPSSRKSSLLKAGHSPAPPEGSSTTKMQLRSTSQTPSEVLPQPLDSPTATQTENISDQSDIEGRIKALKEELRRRKFMAYQLKKEQKKRHKERLKAQEASLLKQLENYNSFIEKTKAELNEELDSSPEAKSQIQDSNSVLEQSSTKPPLHGSETWRSSDRTLVDASLDRNTSAQPNHIRSASETLPEDSSDKEPLTPSVAGQNRPEAVTPEQRGHHSDSILTPLSKVESEDHSIMSELRSDIQEELEAEVSSRSEDGHSHHLLKERRLDSQENFATPKDVSPALDEEHDGFTSDQLEQNAQMKQSKLSKAEEALTLNTDTSAAVDLEASPHARNASSIGEHPHSPKSVASLSNKDAIMKDIDASPIADGYHDDFESASSSPTEEPRSKPEFHDDHDDVVEEDIAEEMSQHSDVSEQSNQSEVLLDLYQHRGDDDEEALSSQAPSVTLQHSHPLSVKDEMPGFTIGDRVLVGGFQSGTLRFKGPTRFANGFWAGVELDQSEGSNNGTYDGVVYFQCEECHGIFAPPDKIAHLPDKFELYADTTEDEDLFFDDLPNKSDNKQKKMKDNSLEQENVENNNTEVHPKDSECRDTKVMEEGNQAPLKEKSHLNSQLNKELTHLISNGNTDDVILDLDNTSHALIISDMDKGELEKQTNKETTTTNSERNHLDSQKPSSPPDFTPEVNEKEQQSKDLLDSFSDKLIHNFVKDTVQQFADIKKAKEQKIKTANVLNGDLFGENNEEESWIFSVKQKDDLPFFLPAEKEKLLSPELCNRPESPVLGASGQEELAKRLAELELSRELVDDFGDDQDWFDEDFGLSSRRKQQKQKEEEAKLGYERGKSPGPLMGGIVSSLGGEPQVKTPPRPELPLPLPPKLPEQPAMVVPHSAKEVEKMVCAATLEIWEAYDLGREGAPTLEQLPNPTPSLDYLGKGSSNKDQEAISIHSYRKAVFDLTWEILQDIYAEDPNTDQPQWVKPRQAKTSSIHRVKTSGDVNKIQEFVTAEVLKLYGLTRDQNQKSDWQKMLKFGRKKRDRVDHILVQELHEEEAQWVNYDEDELFVKLQLADSIFDALLKDTADAFTLISHKRAKRGTLS